MAKQLVFITGATGFIGAQTTDAVLKAGYRVRLSIRKAEQEIGIKKRHAGFLKDVETTVIPDLTKSESFANALDGVDFVLHVASPMPGKAEDFVQEYQKPAVDGTLALLEAALKFKQIQKVVVVSSILALVPLEAYGVSTQHTKANTGEKINVDLSVPFPDGPAGYGKKYHASKILAHQATREFLANKKPHYTLLTLHPVFVLGNSLIQETADEIAGLNNWLWQSIPEETPRFASVWVHVRDVADAHVLALQKDAPTGTEFILSSPSITWDRAAEFIKEKYPVLDTKLKGPFNYNWTADLDAAENILGIRWRSQEDILEDVLDQQLAFRGLKPSGN